MDLLVLAADRDIEHAVKGLLHRQQALGVEVESWRILVHPEHDPGCANKAAEFMRAFSRQYRHGLVILDHEGSGTRLDPADLESKIEYDLTGAGWEDRARAIVIAPELENWVWSDSPHVAETLGWTVGMHDLRQRLQGEGYWPGGAVKPGRPKEAMRYALRHAVPPKRWSAALFQSLAEQVSVKNCEDAAFQRLLATLREWFPQD